MPSKLPKPASPSTTRPSKIIRFAYPGPDGMLYLRIVTPTEVIQGKTMATPLSPNVWYMIGYDQDRGAPRTFRMDRMQAAALAAINKAPDHGLRHLYTYTPAHSVSSSTIVTSSLGAGWASPTSSS